MAVTIGNSEAKTVFTPANIIQSNIGEISKIIMRRKSFIIEKHTCIAFAGDGLKIEEILADAAPLISAWTSLDRPMRRLGDMVNDHEGVECIGVYVNPETGSVNRVSFDSPTTFKYLGLCSAIGSGGHEALAFCRQFDQKYGSTFALSPNTLGRECLSVFAANTLADEIFGRPAPDWGGDIEQILWDPITLRWARNPPTVHLFFICRELGDGRATVDLLARSIAYDGGDNESRILSASISADGPLLTEFVCDDPLRIGDEFNRVPFDAFWKNWKPNRAAITIAFPGPDSSIKYTHTIFDDKFLECVQFQIDQSAFNVEVRQCLLDEIARTALEARGFHYEVG
jgi:hypothetical protein